jgi:hypothetical protein
MTAGLAEYFDRQKNTYHGVNSEKKKTGRPFFRVQPFGFSKD